MSALVKSVRIQGFGCLKDTALNNLTPLHAVIGPNDSGKSTLLRALHSAFNQELPDSSFWLNGEIALIDPNGQFLSVSRREGITTEQGDRAELTGHLRARRLRLDPDALKRPSRLIPTGSALDLLDERGAGLAGVYDAIVNRDVTRFLQIRESTRQLFPSIKTIGFRNTNEHTKELEFELLDGTRVPASLMSEGLLYYLAFAALPHLAPTRLLLIEEPENGLHPARIHEIMRILREVSKQTQVMLATHSPLVINELSGDEVHVITRDPVRGTQARLLGETPNFAERSKVYALGELWLSYADGNMEAPLLEGSPPA
jgi:predicted ATPase